MYAATHRSCCMLGLWRLNVSFLRRLSGESVFVAWIPPKKQFTRTGRGSSYCRCPEEHSFRLPCQRFSELGTVFSKPARPVLSDSLCDESSKVYFWRTVWSRQCLQRPPPLLAPNSGISASPRSSIVLSSCCAAMQSPSAPGPRLA